VAPRITKRCGSAVNVDISDQACGISWSFPCRGGLVQNNIDSINPLKQLHLLGEAHLVAPRASLELLRACARNCHALAFNRALTLAGSGRF
jgi:hypothetical protein